MEKTWIRFLLPDDEYKRRTMLVYFAEAAVLQLIAVLALLVILRFDFVPPLDSATVLVGLMIGTMAYIWIRYILSGMEFAEIMTEKAYRRERKVIAIKSTSFLVIICMSISLLYIFGDPSVSLIEGLIFSFIAALLLFFTNYVSLRKSYRKNRELID
ncbi:hypothetical protein SFC66_05070 [Terribacillus saccharophilus]|uniref:hypothetical protein n=1 Tax=Terribacillus saccharophilus TaxID=361277 RepID=UPI0039824BED